MFERYTQKARRVVYFARESAKAYGSLYIATEHLLLGLIKEDRALVRRFARKGIKEIRTQIDAQVTRSEPIAITALPLTSEAKYVLSLAADSADRMGDRRIGPKHLLLGILRAENCIAARIITS
jgi:ATP-dependent Clp protease ATP-binding subunit ClpC